MFDQAFENFRQATESSMQLQQEMLKNWMNLWSGQLPTAMQGMPSMPSPVESLTQLRKKWETLVADSLKRQREMVDSQFAAGLRTLEDAFRTADAKNPQELRDQLLALYRKCFESLKQLSEAQLREYKLAVEQWSEVMLKGAA